MDMGSIICFKFFFIYGGLVSVPRHAQMVLNIDIYVFKSRINYGFLYALILGKICLGKCSLWPMTAIACFIFLMVAEFQYTLFSRLFYFFVGG